MIDFTYVSENTIKGSQTYYTYDSNQWEYKRSTTKLNSFYEEILFCNKVLRVSDSSDTPYKLHKSYPSARSFYPLKIWISLGEGLFITNEDLKDKFYVYFNKNLINTKRNSIIISNESIHYDKYKPIHKTLENLEIGHLLYNLISVCEMYENTYTIDNTDENITKLIAHGEIKDTLIDVEAKKTFDEKSMLRNSGSYFKKIMNLDFHKIQTFYEISIDLEKYYNKYFSKSFEQPLVIDYFFNNKYDGFDSRLTNIPYYKLNREYDFIDFSTCSQYTLISLKSNFQQNKVNLANDIQFIGFVAQDICLKNSYYKFYNRPVKQVVPLTWKNEYLGQEALGTIPFYGVISGWENK